MSEGLTWRLARFAGGPAPNDNDARHMMRLSLLDWAACGIAGADEPVSRIILDMAAAEAGKAEALVIGSNTRLPARAAALVNGATSHALDYDDTHFAHIGHPSVAVLPAALAIAEQTHAEGAAFLDAALIGVETSIRVGVWLGRDHYQTGFHQTATAGTFGAAAAAGRLLGLNHEQMTHALGLAATKAAGLKSQFGTMGKPYNAGQAAAAGVEVALLAARGFVSTPVGMEGAQGFGATHGGLSDDTALDDIGHGWRFKAISHKFHACCHGTHAMIEALQGVEGDIASVEVTTHPRWLSVCNIAAPQTGLEVKFSYRHIAAMVLSGIDTSGLLSFSDKIAHDPALCARRDLVQVRADDAVPETASHVRVTLKGGGEIAGFHDLALPMSLETRQAKLLAKTWALVGDARAEDLSRCVLGTDRLDLAAFAAALGQ